MIGFPMSFELEPIVHATRSHPVESNKDKTHTSYVNIYEESVCGGGLWESMGPACRRR